MLFDCVEASAQKRQRLNGFHREQAADASQYFRHLLEQTGRLTRGNKDTWMSPLSSFASKSSSPLLSERSSRSARKDSAKVAMKLFYIPLADEWCES